MSSTNISTDEYAAFIDYWTKNPGYPQQHYIDWFGHTHHKHIVHDCNGSSPIPMPETPSNDRKRHATNEPLPTPPPTSKRSRSATTGQNYSRREGRTEFYGIGEFLGYVEDFHDRLYVFEHDLSIRRIRFEKDIGGLKYDRRELERSERQLNVRESKVEKREGDVTTREMALQAETERAYNKHRDYEREKFSSEFNEERRMHQQKLERLQEDGKRYQQKLRESEVVRQQEREALEEKLKIAGEEKRKAQRLIQALKQKHEAMGMDMSEIEQAVSAS